MALMCNLTSKTNDLVLKLFDLYLELCTSLHQLMVFHFQHIPDLHML